MDNEEAFAKDKKHLWLKIALIVTAAVVALWFFLKLFVYVAVPWFYEHGAYKVSVWYQIDDTRIIGSNGDDEDFDVSNLEPNQVYEVKDSKNVIITFPGTDEPVIIPTYDEKHSYMDLETCYLVDEDYYLIFNAVKDGHMPLTNKNHSFDALFLVDPETREKNELFRSGEGEYILYGDSEEVICFESFERKIIKRELESEDCEVIKTLNEEEEYRFQVFDNNIIVNGNSVVEITN